MKQEIFEIPFGAKDSELGGWEYTIPEGFVAEINDGKVIVKKADSEDERIRKALVEGVRQIRCKDGITQEQMLAWLEKQKEQTLFEEVMNKMSAISQQVLKEQKPPVTGNDFGWIDELKHDLEHPEELDRKVQEALKKRQKPAEKQDYSGLNELERAILRGFLCAGVDNVPVTIIKETAQDCLAQIKPVEWSEDDLICLGYLADFVDENGDKFYGDNKPNVVKWIKSFMNHPIPESAEWNKEYREEDLRTRFAFYTYKDEDDALYLSNVFVEEASRNKGFGTKILIAAEKVAEVIGATSIRLKVKQNTSANAWYRKKGYGYMTFEDGYDWLEKRLEYLKPKQEWSKEDEQMFWGFTAYIPNEELERLGVTRDDILKKLKSLRLQPKREWSEEDEKMLEKCVGYMTKITPIPDKERFVRFETIKDEECINWLESLRPQPKAELTLLDENIIKAAVAFVEQNDHFSYWAGIDKHTVIKALRSLKPHWKPSEEEMEVEFEKEYKSYMKSRKDDISGNAVTLNMKDLARHFYELGLNARKEE